MQAEMIIYTLFEKEKKREVTQKKKEKKKNQILWYLDMTPFIY